MLTAHARLEKNLKEVPEKFLQFSEEEASFKSSPEKWSKKEILGHLIDSASNNHQRFVRMQMENNLSLPIYEQDEWVAIQQYQKKSWKEIISLWKNYNSHLLHILSNADETKFSNTATFPRYGIQTLQFIIDDYVDHMEHHLKQIL